MHVLKPKLRLYFKEYDAYHTHSLNRLTHKIAIPLIVFHIVAMLGWVELWTLPNGWTLTLAHLAYLMVVLWYLSLDLWLGLWLAVLYALCFPVARITPLWLVIAIAALGWLIQLAGHVVWEKRQPAFFTNLLQALIGPMYFVALLTGAWK